MAEELTLTTVERFIPAPPELIFDLLVQPRRHVEIDGSDSVQAVKTGPERVSLGEAFVMKMGRRLRYSTISTVIEFEPYRRIAWQTYSTVGWLARLGGGRIWRYELEPTDGGTTVRETWDLTQEVPRSRRGLSRDIVRNHMISAMEKSLVRIEEIVTRS